jgi:hypothetical protein
MQPQEQEFDAFSPSSHLEGTSAGVTQGLAPVFEIKTDISAPGREARWRDHFESSFLTELR